MIGLSQQTLIDKAQRSVGSVRRADRPTSISTSSRLPRLDRDTKYHGSGVLDLSTYACPHRLNEENVLPGRRQARYSPSCWLHGSRVPPPRAPVSGVLDTRRSTSAPTSMREPSPNSSFPAAGTDIVRHGGQGPLRLIVAHASWVFGRLLGASPGYGGLALLAPHDMTSPFPRILVSTPRKVGTRMALRVLLHHLIDFHLYLTLPNPGGLL